MRNSLLGNAEPLTSVRDCGVDERTMSRLRFLIQVSRPIVWPVLPLVYGLGLHAAHAELTAAAIIQMLLLTFPMNLIGCGLNDIYDYESDRRSPRRRAIWGAVVHRRQTGHSFCRHAWR